MRSSSSCLMWAVTIAEIEKSEASLEEKARRKDRTAARVRHQDERIHTKRTSRSVPTPVREGRGVRGDDSKVKIVDEQTGRIMEAAATAMGCTQAYREQGERKVRPPRRPMPPSPLQNYFRMYHKLSA